MLELTELERLIVEEECYSLQIKVPKSLFWHYKTFFDCMDAFARDMSYTDLKGNTKRYALKAESQGLSYAASYPSTMRDLLEIILDDYSRNFVKNSVEWTEPVLK